MRSDLMTLRYGSWAEQALKLPPERILREKLENNYKLAEQFQNIIENGSNEDLQAFSDMMEKR